MKHQRRIKTLSKITQTLLSQGESELADFKRTPEGVNTDDLVAFANTDAGGTILVGIDEQTGADGMQRGIVRGCDVSDAAILQILNKAVSCVPPVAVMVHAENLSAKPILRIVVPQSESKPHCTPKGVYCRRDGSRNRPLHPGELLRIFLETEARAFAERFESTANKVVEGLDNLETALEDSIRSMGEKLGWAEYQLGDTESTLGSVLAYVRAINDQTQDATTRLRALFRQDKRDDPIRATARKELLDQAVKQLSEDRSLLDQIQRGGTTSLTAKGKPALELDEDDLRSILTEAVAIALNRRDGEKYTIEVKSPSKATEDELDKFAELVTAGGEVADGLRQRLETASALGFLRYDGAVVGTAALKKPAAGYHRGVFENAKSERAVSSYTLELGWIYLDVEHRGKKRMPPLIDAVVKHAKGSGVFATTRTSNRKMMDILSRQGFVREGSAYPSKQTPGDEIALFLRSLKAASKPSKTAG